MNADMGYLLLEARLILETGLIIPFEVLDELLDRENGLMPPDDVGLGGGRIDLFSEGFSW